MKNSFNLYNEQFIVTTMKNFYFIGKKEDKYCEEKAFQLRSEKQIGHTVHRYHKSLMKNY